MNKCATIVQKSFRHSKSNNILFDGIYDNRLLIKITPALASFNLPTALPYPGAKPMYFVENVDDKPFLAKIINTTLKGLK